MNFIKYQRSEWEFQKVRIKKIVGHCDAALPEQYVNTLLTMLEERNSPKIDDYDTHTDEQVTIDKIKIETEINASLKCERCGDHVSQSLIKKTFLENSRLGKVTAFYCKSCAALLRQKGRKF